MGQDVFHWSAPAGFGGFSHGKYVDSKSLPGNDAMSGLRDFTLFVRAKNTGIFVR